MVVADAVENYEVNAETSPKHVPNTVTLAAMQEAEEMLNGKKPCTWHKSPENLINALKDEIDL